MSTDPIETIAERHVSQSIDEVESAEKRERWQSGERAREQAIEIVSALVAEATKELEQGDDNHGEK